MDEVHFASDRSDAETSRSANGVAVRQCAPALLSVDHMLVLRATGRTDTKPLIYPDDLPSASHRRESRTDAGMSQGARKNHKIHGPPPVRIARALNALPRHS
jgi:hypothetical protein